MKTEYIEAARALGVADRKAILRHVLPNVLTPIIILAAIQMPRNIMLESTLSFLGVGLPVTTPSLGLLIARGFRVLFSGAWWITVFPGLVLMLSVLAVNLLGDWLRDVLDPRFHPGRYQS
jgi:peptide/nickel transport system permease protein